MEKNKLNSVLNILMGAAAGVFIGYGAYTLWDYKAHPGLYAMQSAPWYRGILVYGVVAAVILVLGFVLKQIMRKSAKK